MPRLQPRLEAPRHPVVPPFARIVCGVDGSRWSEEGVRQAVALAGAGVDLAFVAVATTAGVGRFSRVGRLRAEGAVAAARRVAERAGVHATGLVREAVDPRALLLAEAAGRDLLVLGTRPGSRAGGILLGRTATAAAHHSPCSILLARGQGLSGSLVLGTDGGEASAPAALLAARVARRLGARVTVVRSVDGGSRSPDRHAAAVERITGDPAALRVTRGPATEAILGVAGETGASLIVTGSRGLTGLRALGSVSERVASRAGCSVLIARGAR